MKIRTKLIISFIIPILFIITLGIASYRTAAEGICNSYELSTARSLKMSAEFLRLVLILSKRLQYNTLMTTRLNFTNGFYKR